MLSLVGHDAQAARSFIESFTVAIEIPFSVVERADRPGLQPSRNAVEMEGVVADAPRLVALLL